MKILKNNKEDDHCDEGYNEEFNGIYDDETKLGFSDILAMFIALIQLILPILLLIVLVYFLAILFITSVWL
ncbi:MAG: hypothetical protein ACK5LT_09990 [Lachnospirales bacterium]